MSWKLRGGLCWGLGLASVALSGVAKAQEAQEAAQEAEPALRRRSYEALQLTLHGALVDYAKETLKPKQLEGSALQPEERETSVTTFGPLGAGLGFGIGYAWNQVLFGARATLVNKDSSLPGSQEVSETVISLLPRLEYMFDSDAVRPFIAGLVGIQHNAASSTQDSGFDEVKIEDSNTRFGLGAAFGLHAFLNDHVSLDPELTALYATGSGTTKGTIAGSTGTSSRDYDLSGFRVMLSLGLSGWIDTGGRASPVYAAPPRPAPAAPVASEEQETERVATDLRLPKHRSLYLQISKDPARHSILVRLTESPDESSLATCDDVAVFESGGPIKLSLRSRGEHYLTGRLSVHALEVLARDPEATISVCTEQWKTSPKSRDGIQKFLNARRDLLEELGESDESAAPAPAAVPAAMPAAQPATAPTVAPSTPPPSSTTPPGPATPSAPATSSAPPRAPAPTPAPRTAPPPSAPAPNSGAPSKPLGF